MDSSSASSRTSSHQDSPSSQRLQDPSDLLLHLLPLHRAVSSTRTSAFFGQHQPPQQQQHQQYYRFIGQQQQHRYQDSRFRQQPQQQQQQGYQAISKAHKVGDGARTSAWRAHKHIIRQHVFIFIPHFLFHIFHQHTYINIMLYPYCRILFE